MVSWSVDGIHELGNAVEKNVVVRLVSANDLIKNGSAVRYVGISPELVDDLSWGKCIIPHWKKIKQRDQRTGLRIINHRSFYDYDKEAEERLRNDVSVLIDTASNQRDGGDVVADSSSCTGRIQARIHVHNVGQGDTIVLELPGDQLWIIDARLWGAGRRQKFDEWMQQFKGKNFAKLIISHFHYDHIHSIPFIIKKYHPKEVIFPGSLVHPTATTLRVLNASKGRMRSLINRQTQQLLFEKLKITLFASNRFSPDADDSKDPNFHEVGLCLSTPSTRVLLAGDMPAVQCKGATEEYLSAPASHSYYKVSHHGSRTGYSRDFLKALTPSYSVISCAMNNRFSHPHAEVFNGLSGHVGRTDKMHKFAVDTYEVI